MARPRIKTLEICDFRAFPGPAPVTIELAGKNLFLFGENGVGKSTIFHALDGLFAVNTSADELKALLIKEANRFTPGDKRGDSRVAVTYDDGELSATWSKDGHPIDVAPGPANERIVNTAWAKAILDYRSLLATNYDHEDEVNLFWVCVEGLLRDYVFEGERIGEVWQRLLAMLERPQLREAQIREINQDSRRLNNGLAEALDAVTPLINPLLDDLGHGDVRVAALVPKRIAYNNSGRKEWRDFNDCEITPAITFHGGAVEHPQLFLNEARLSALALAIYFAGRKLAEQQARNDMPRIMVLDDVLIGLDQANRLPLLDVLCKHFQDWQVILLTHDRTWFDIGRQYLRKGGPPHWRGRADEYWTFWQLHQHGDHRDVPIATELGASVAAQALTVARRFVKDGHVHAAGNAARLATEFALREFCAVKDVSVPYVQPPGFLPASKFLECIEIFDKGSQHYKSIIDSVRMYTTILLNPLSHGGTAEVTPNEVLAAIEVVDKLLFSLTTLPTAEMKRRRAEAGD
ncbi:MULTISPECIES: AAA family ATPase [unclassified Sphingomonas]|uniref:AAA family ATPase n=1 Tax=unclassified Sphingomonas TaxID=196159 RepID=UPI00285611F9|nr:MULTISPECIES: AAA family ATPase [unclassified Sphingomonas]MDR6114494.1 energy-coupling factor transporter ATP-binding protein EcfA2 [Sphingomonas sp. SORGH_AS_0789]MDR6148147.1 energy-coupling factor transporter ATP-binding protein EcfA2 [Sphingomonas sp. SORGH_AS_0742]